MRVSLEWLATCVDVSGLEPEVIAEALTNAGLEVESIERVGGQFDGVIVGHVQAVDPHPNADRLRLVTVNTGSAGINQVVCGAPNVAVGQRIAYAPVGAKVLSKKDGAMFELTPATIRGVASTGMICSLDELGLEAQYEKLEDGIWPITDRTTDADLGRLLNDVLGLAEDIVLDVTPNANRGDLMSIRGVAREVAALFNRKLSLPEPSTAQGTGTIPFSVSLLDASVCQFYTGALLSNVTVGPSPDWMARRLLNAGIRSINNVVDITNYVMLETGQPLHAFDVATLSGGGTIGVRRAQAGETLACLDDVTRTLTSEAVVVTCNDASVALAGVMGGSATGIQDETTSVFLESAYFPSATTRKSARSAGVRTESSARFERGVDPLGCERAFYRAIELLQAHAGATLQGQCHADTREKAPLTVTLRLKRMADILGLVIPTEQVITSLEALGFGVSTQPDDTMAVTIPSFRHNDVMREIDVIEEVIRIFGYDAIPYTLPQSGGEAERSPRQRTLALIRQTMTACGLSEVVSHSLIGPGLLEKTGMSQDLTTTVHVTNSQSREHTLLRQSVVPNLLDILRHNQAQGNAAFWAFELGRTYIKKKPPTDKESGVLEQLNLSGILAGETHQGTWHQAQTTDFYTAKGVLESLFGALGLESNCRWMAASDLPGLHPGQTAQIKLGKLVLGWVGRLHPLQEEHLKLKGPVFVFELNADALIEARLKKPGVLVVEAMSAYPSVSRDMAFLAPLSVTHHQIKSALGQVASPWVKELALFDEYRGDRLPEGTRSLAYRVTLQSDSGTLTDSEIDGTVQKLKEQLVAQLPQVSLR